MPLFGGRRAVWVKAGGRNIAAAVEAVVGDAAGRLPRRDRGRRPAPQRAAARAVREGEDRRGHRLLRRQRARSRAADRRRDARRPGCTIAPDARAALVPLLGGDRPPRAARSASSRSTPTASKRSSSTTCWRSRRRLGAGARRVVDAAFAGQDRGGRERNSQGCAAPARRRARSVGARCVRWRSCTLQARVDAATALDRRCGGLPPAIHFRRKRSVEGALRTWTAPRLGARWQQLRTTALESAPAPALADAMAQRALLSTAQIGARGGGKNRATLRADVCSWPELLPRSGTRHRRTAYSGCHKPGDDDRSSGGSERCRGA